MQLYHPSASLLFLFLFSFFWSFSEAPVPITIFGRVSHGVRQIESTSSSLKTFPDNTEERDLGSPTLVLYSCQSPRDSTFPTTLFPSVALEIFHMDMCDEISVRL
jgi:hypothetical protein